MRNIIIIYYIFYVYKNWQQCALDTPLPHHSIGKFIFENYMFNMYTFRITQNISFVHEFSS